MAQTTESTSLELTRRHRTASLAVVGTMVLTLLLVALALSGILFREGRAPDPSLAFGLRLMIVFFGVGAVVLRRTRFSAVRLQDIAGARGVSALLATLQNTTMLLALIGGAIAIMGFIFTMGSGDGTDMIWLGAIALVVLLYAYPRRAAWQRVVDATQTNNLAPAPSVKGTAA